MRHALGGGAKAGKAFGRPGLASAARELREGRLAEEEPDVQLVAAFGNEERLVTALPWRERAPHRLIDEEVPRLHRLFQSVDGLQ